MAENAKTTSKKKMFQGVVVSNKMDKTVKVVVEVPLRHPRYHKQIERRSFFFAHTEKKYEVGDRVWIRESRPYSKNVRWVVAE